MIKIKNIIDCFRPGVDYKYFFIDACYRAVYHQNTMDGLEKLKSIQKRLLLIIIIHMKKMNLVRGFLHTIRHTFRAKMLIPKIQFGTLF